MVFAMADDPLQHEDEDVKKLREKIKKKTEETEAAQDNGR
jgi:hypothetical protein